MNVKRLSKVSQPFFYTVPDGEIFRLSDSKELHFTLRQPLFN